MTPVKPNIIFIVLDTHRSERMPLYGYHRDTSPHIGEFAEDATVFDWAIAPAPWTIPSHASMFTGLYPIVHQTNQTYNTLPKNIPTLAELLNQNGYETLAFCNNPLVGLLENGFTRGFERFYNYSGALPDIPAYADETLYRKTVRKTSEIMRKLTLPTMRRAGAGNQTGFLRMMMQPLFTPFWTKLGNFKGNTKLSITDANMYLKYRRSSGNERPFFMFINMMETHTPYYPPRIITDIWMPYLKKDREARDFLQKFNTSSYRWNTPLFDPMTEKETNILRDVYDTEIAFQDRHLGRLFRVLKKSDLLDDTMVIILSDHGESQSDHGYMGHGFVNYNEVVRVPLIIRYPDKYPSGHRITHNISTRRIFHTILDAAGVSHEAYGETVEDLTLHRSLKGPENEPEQETVVAEAFPPQNFISVMEVNNPRDIDRFYCRSMRRTLYNSRTKLTMLDGRPFEFFDVREDLLEMNNLIDNPFGYENDLLHMQKKIEEFTVIQEAHRDGTAAGAQIDYTDNPEILERLRKLGYIE